MGKTHRGVSLKKEVPRSGRGYCKVTKRSGVKLLYDYEFEGKKIKVSKLGRAILENKRKAAEKSSKAEAAKKSILKVKESAKAAPAKEPKVVKDTKTEEKSAKVAPEAQKTSS